MSYSILPVTSDDIPQLGEYLYWAKLALPINRLLVKEWPNVDAQKKNYSESVANSFADPSSDYWKAVDDASGETVGFVVLSLQQPVTETPPARDVPDSMNPEVFTAVMDMAEQTEADMKDKEHLDLTYIFVLPSHRRRGLGTRLVDECCRKAKSTGLPLAATSEPEAHQFFSKLGFDEKMYLDIDLKKWAAPDSGFGNFRMTRWRWTSPSL